MFRKDPIFWWASGIFVLALLLFAITQNDLCLALAIGSYLLRPTLASLGVANHHIDERQLSIHYRSSNIAFVVMIATSIILAAKLKAEGNHGAEMFYMLIVIGLAAKALFNVVLAKNLRDGATKIIVSAGLLITLFVGMNSVEQGVAGFIMNVIPGLVIVGVGIFSKYFPRLAGLLIFLIAAFLEFVILRRGLTWPQIGTAFIVGVPFIIAGLCLFSRVQEDREAEPEKSGPEE